MTDPFDSESINKFADAVRGARVLVGDFCSEYGAESLMYLLAAIEERFDICLEIIVSRGELEDNAMKRHGVFLESIFYDGVQTEACDKLFAAVASTIKQSISDIVDEVLTDPDL